jgi:hypothetical protein
MTIRRAQGSTLDLVGLWFDHSYPADRGYAYVGASRVRMARDLYLVGKVKRTDWLPVGGNAAEEQLFRGSASQTTSSGSNQGSEDQGASSDEGSEDQGASDSASSAEDEGASDLDIAGDPDASDSDDEGASDPDDA